MDNESLKNDLEKLRIEVNQVAANNPAARDKLIALITDLEKRIDSSSTEDDENLIEKIREEILSFEAEHPRATAILNDIMVTLSNMGI